jgi:hypothetical protein
VGRLSQPSWSRRARAHQELLRRGPPKGSGPTGLHAEHPALPHLPWFSVAEGTEGIRTLRQFCRHSRSYVRLQAVRAMTDTAADPYDGFIDALADREPRIN